jgi:hypothetical protein
VLAVSSFVALTVGFAGAANAQLLDRLQHRAAKGAVKNGTAPRTFVAPNALTKGGPASVQPNRAAIQPTPGALGKPPLANPGMTNPDSTRAANPAVGIPRSPTVTNTNGVPPVTNAVDPRSRLNPTDPSRRLNSATTNPRAPSPGVNDPRIRPNAGIDSPGGQTADPQGRQNPSHVNAVNNLRARLNPVDARNRLNGATDPRGRFNPGDRPGGLHASADPRGRFQGPVDFRSRLIEAGGTGHLNVAVVDRRERDRTFRIRVSYSKRCDIGREEGRERVKRGEEIGGVGGR